MIKYTLNCKNGHQFDSWFSDSGSFEKLKKKGYYFKFPKLLAIGIWANHFGFMGGKDI